MATITSVASGLASAAGTWDISVPVEGDKVIIAAGHTVTIDGTYTWGDDSVTATIPNAAINVSGTLKASRSASSNLTCKGLLLINGNGALDYGTDADPILLPITATLTLNKRTTAAAGDGLLQITPSGTQTASWSFVGDNGASTKRARAVALASNSVVNGSNCDIVLTSATHNWAVGDEILLMPTTDAASGDEHELGTIASISTDKLTITLTTGAIENRSGTTRTALEYVHKSGSPACNLSSNVTVTSHTWGTNGARINYSFASTAYSQTYTWKHCAIRGINGNSGTTAGMLRHSGLMGAACSQSVEYAAFRSYTSSNKPSAQYLISGNSSSFPCTLKQSVSYAGSVSYGASYIKVEDCKLAINGHFTDSNFGNGYIVTHSNCWVSFLSPNDTCFGVFHEYLNFTVTGINTSVNGYKFTDSDLGYTYGWKPQFSGDYFYRYSTLNSLVQVTLDNCKVDSSIEIPHTEATFALYNSDSYFILINKNQDVTAQERRYPRGTVIRNNTTITRSTSSIEMKPYLSGQDLTFDFDIACANGSSVTLVGYVQINSAFYNSGATTYPTVVISGLGDSDTFTSTSASNGAWEKYTLTVTNNSGVDGYFTVTMTANALNSTITGASGKVYFDGLPDGVFVTKCRHYGFTFDESNPARTVNATVSASEATAAAYTGMALTSSSVTLSADQTFQKLYDYSQAWGCLNLSSSVPITGAGVAGNPTVFAGANVTINTGFKLNGAGALSMGSYTLSTEFSGGSAYTYTGGSWAQSSTVPSFNGGTVSIGAAGTYNFSLTDAILKMTPSAPSTYALGGATFSGTVDLRNQAAHAITVQLPSGTSYTTANNTGGAITVSTPTVNQSVTVNGLVAGSRLQIYDTTHSTELYNDIVSGTTYTWNDPSPAASSRAIRLRIAYVSGATAKLFVDVAIGTCGTTSGDAAISYLANQSNDVVYNSNAINGSTLTGYVIVGTNLTIDVSDGSATWGEMYAYQVYWLFTSGGIADQDLYIEATDTANYVFFGGFKIKNTSSPTVPLLVTGGNGEPSTGPATDLLDTTGGTIFCNSAVVVPYSSGAEATIAIVQSGLTAQGYTSPRANKIDTIPADVWQHSLP